jgi:hypothetical protein
VWNYSPRQLKGFLVVSGKRRKREMAQLVSAVQLATRGDNKEIKRALRKWLAG